MFENDFFLLLKEFSKKLVYQAQSWMIAFKQKF